MLAQSCKFGVNCCFIGLTHPVACTRARVPLTFGHIHRPPPVNPFAQKGCQSTGLELRILTVYLRFRRSGPVHFWRGVPKTRTHPSPPPPPIRLIHISIESSRTEDSDYVIFNRFDTCRPKVKLTGASWVYVHINNTHTGATHTNTHTHTHKAPSLHTWIVKTNAH